MQRFALFLILFSTQAFGWNTPTQGSMGNKYTKWTWTGAAGTTNWATPGNWCGVYMNGSCQGATTKPPSTATVVFNDICQTYSNCSPVLTANETISGLQLDPSYTGTVDTSTYNFTIDKNLHIGGGTLKHTSGTVAVMSNASGSLSIRMEGGTWDQGGATVNVGTSTVTTNTWTNTGGTVIATSATLKIWATTNWTGWSNFTTPNGGTTEFGYSTAATPLATLDNVTFNHLVLKVPNSDMTVTGVVNVAGDLTLTGVTINADLGGSGTIYMSGGNFYHTGNDVPGNVKIIFTGTAPQILDNTAVAVGQEQVPRFELNAAGVAGGMEIKGNTTFSGFIHTGMGTVTVSSGRPKFTIGGFGDPAIHNAPNTTFNEIVVDAAGTGSYMTIGTLKTGDLELTGSSTVCIGDGGIIEVTGDVLSSQRFCGGVQLHMKGTVDQNIDVSGSATGFLPGIRIEKPSGTLTFTGTPYIHSGHFQYISGTVTIPTTIGFTKTNSNGGSAITANGLTFTNIKLGTSGNGTTTLNDSFTMTGNLTIEGGLTVNAAATQTISVEGNITCTAGTGISGTGKIKLTGVNQTIDMTAVAAGCAMPRLEFAASGTSTVKGTVNLFHALTYSTGTADWTTHSAVLKTVNNTNLTSTTGTMELFDLHYTATGTKTFSGTTIVKGSVYLTAPSSGRNMAGSYDVYGNLSATGFGVGFSAAFNLRGTTNTTFTHTASAFPTGLITVNKTGGAKVSLASNVTLNSGQDITVSSGSIDLAGYNLTMPGTAGSAVLTLAAGTTVKLSGGTLSVNGSTVSTGAYSGGTIVP